MEQQKILNLLNAASDSKFVTRKWNIVNDNSKSNYDATNEITYNTEILKSNLCDYNKAYILLRGDTTVVTATATQVAFKNYAPFAPNCAPAIDLDLVMQMCNLIEYSSSYSETTGTLWFYSKDEANNFNADIVNDDNFKSFKCKAKLLANTAAQHAPNAPNGILKNAAISVPLKYLSNFWRSLKMPLINCKVELKLRWTKDLKDQFIGMNIKQKKIIKIQQKNLDFFLKFCWS